MMNKNFALIALALGLSFVSTVKAADANVAVETNNNEVIETVVTEPTTTPARSWSEFATAWNKTLVTDPYNTVTGAPLYVSIPTGIAATAVLAIAIDMLVSRKDLTKSQTAKLLKWIGILSKQEKAKVVASN